MDGWIWFLNRGFRFVRLVVLIGGNGFGFGVGFDPTPQIFDQTDCEGAFSVDSVVGGSIFGDITETAVVSPVDTCEVIFRNGIGVWYSLVAQNDTRLVVSTCESNFDTQLSIFTGPSCGKLRCVAGSDQVESCGTGDQSKVAFSATTGQSYYIYVQARRNTRQIFSLAIDRRWAMDFQKDIINCTYI